MSKNNKQNNWLNIIYWSIAGLVIWALILIIGIFVTKQTTSDSLMISSVVMFCIYGLASLLKFGLFEGTVVNYQNLINDSEKAKKKRKALGKEPYIKQTIKTHQEKLKERSWLPIIVGIGIYLVLAIVAGVM